ncbi:MAG: NAD(P)H-hydrate dehydratase [Bacteroidales bacterium]|nr:NAD(P)H-hydrate dehydratase [Bacteroidales bacterium]
MKILPIEEVRNADAYTIANEPIASIDLMERAASQIYKWIKKRVPKKHLIRVYAGLGNNGGDGLVVARLLSNKGYQVEVNVIRYSDTSSEDFQVNFGRLKEGNSIAIRNVKELKNLSGINPDDVLVDAIFGSGLTRPVKGFIADVIAHINNSPAMRIAIDVPSGLFSDSTSKNNGGAIVHADYTLSFQFPKLAFLFPENDVFVGNWQLLDIGLHPDFINEVETQNFFMGKRDIKPILKKRGRYAHKGSFGHALLIAGCYGKMGAAILASRACLRSGVGLLHSHIPKAGYQIMQTATPETMLSIDRYDNYFSEVPKLGLYTAIGIGPGLGMEKQSQMALKLLIQEYPNPIVFDADALNILSENKTWLAFLPKGSILTPHPKEFERLATKWSNDFERLEMQRDFAFKYGVYVVLKGAHTSICFPDGNCYFNSTGNPGMATAGSGDVLTGLITGLLAQGYSPGQASVLGVYLHGLAGDIAAKKHGMEALLAGDLIEQIGKAFRKLTLP